MLTEADLVAVEREYCRRSLANFAKRAWPVLEPGTELKWGWALDAICEHLEAVTHGDITRLLMNVPPGSMKSLLTSVLWPAWEWGPQEMPDKRFLGTAHQQNLAIRDSMKCRRLIQSEWYQTLWQTKLTTDQNAKTKFENSATGFREAMAFTSMTGSRGDRVILDDPLSADGANSAAELENTRLTFTETLPTRVNDPDLSAIVIIMQRLHEKDTSGIILDMGLPYTHLCIPMRFESERRCTTSIGWTDPRTSEGELMFPERFSEENVQELEHTLGAYGMAGQLQQRPSPRGGGMFKSEWFERHQEAPRGHIYITSDFAVSEGKGDYTEHGVWCYAADEKLYQVDWWHGQTASNEWVDALISLIKLYKPLCYFGEQGVIEKAVRPMLLRRMRQQQVHCRMEWVPSITDKATRARSFQARAAMGNVSLLYDQRGERLIDQLLTFPASKHDDAVDVCSLMGMVIDKAHPAVLKPRDIPKVRDIWDEPDGIHETEDWKIA